MKVQKGQLCLKFELNVSLNFEITYVRRRWLRCLDLLVRPVPAWWDSSWCRCPPWSCRSRSKQRSWSSRTRTRRTNDPKRRYEEIVTNIRIMNWGCSFPHPAKVWILDAPWTHGNKEERRQSRHQGGGDDRQEGEGQKSEGSVPSAVETQDNIY